MDLIFRRVPQKAVDLEVIRDFIEDEHPKRIHFATYHRNALRRVEGKENVVGRLVLPFNEPFDSIARKCLSMDSFLFASRFGNGYYRQIFSEMEFLQVESFIEKVKDLVFLRDTLDLSVALSMHETEPGIRTPLGEHEFRVKYRSDSTDVSADKSALADEMQRRLEELPYFKFADYICAIPSRRPFMKEIIGSLKGFDFVDISNQMDWENKSGSLKDVATAEEKLDMIQSWGLRFGEDTDLNGKTVLLVDDMYQSGVTLQYIAMRMKEVGAKRVFGMTLVKSLGN